MNGIGEVPWLKHARKDLGLHEIPGSEHAPRILELADNAGLGWINDDETPWCAIAVGGWLAETKIVPSKSAAARSYLNWGFDVWEGGKGMIPRGAIIVFKRDPNPTQGHVAIALGQTRDGKIVCIGGNQKNEVTIAPFAWDRIIGARWPIEWRSDIRMARDQLPFLADFKTVSTNEA